MKESLRTAALWADRLPRTAGGFAEQVLQDWTEAPAPGSAGLERTALVQARLAYVFLHSGLPEGLHALATLNRVFLLPGRSGWIRSADCDGLPLDGTVDAYDQAFGLLALAYDRDAMGRARPESLELALQVLRGLDRTWDSAEGGYSEFREGDLPTATRPGPSRLVADGTLRRQNPHMHLFESFLAWMEADPYGPWRDRAVRIATLLESRFVAPLGYLGEFFAEDWSPAPGAPGRQLEPGHHFEWVWLLFRYERLTGDQSFRRTAEGLYRFGLEHGLDGDGLAWDGIDPEGRVLARTKMLWPQTELLKAHLAVYGASGNRIAREAALAVARALKARYSAKGEAPFRNRLGPDGAPLDMPTPSRVLYHLFIALGELERAA